MPDTKLPTRLFRAGSIAFALMPLVLAVSYALHFLGEFRPADALRLRWVYVQPPPERFMELFRSDALLAFTVPHLLIFLALPLAIPATIAFAARLAPRSPRLALTGALLALVGTIYMGGVFGAWLTFPAIGTVRPEEVQGALPALAALIRHPPMLRLSMTLGALTLVGLATIAAGLLATRAIPRWQALLVLLGNVAILAFMDIDNLMFLGALAWFVGAVPLARAPAPWEVPAAGAEGPGAA